MSDFRKGDKLKLTTGEEISIVDKIGEGGQGAVYRVLLNSQEYALKWYLPQYLKRLKPNYKSFYKNLKYNVATGSPSPAFLWQKSRSHYRKAKQGLWIYHGSPASGV